MECHFCELEREGLPFHCNYCGEMYCSEHRLPENHACPRVGGRKMAGYADAGPLNKQPRDKSAGITVRSNRSRFRLRYPRVFSETEQKHILVATTVMVLVGISLVFPAVFSQPLILFLVIPGFIISFLGHELAHKFVAQRNGLWAEFRTSMYGIMLTAMSVILPFKFLAPGQVTVQGTANRHLLGIVGLVGPALNLGLGSVFFTLGKFSPPILVSALFGLTMFNAWLALFNLIPFGSFDGTSVFHWDKTRWAISFGASCFLLVLCFFPSLI